MRICARMHNNIITLHGRGHGIALLTQQLPKQNSATGEARRTLGMELKLSLWLWALSLVVLNSSSEAGAFNGII